MTNPLIVNSGLAKTLATDKNKACKYSNLNIQLERLGINVTQNTYDDVKKWIEDKKKGILKEQYEKLDQSTIPRYVKTEWPGFGTMYGKVVSFTYTHWSVPLFSNGDIELGVKFKTTRPSGRREHNGWVCPGGKDRHKFGELHEFLEEITKEEYDNQPEILLTEEQYSQRNKGAAWSKSATALGFVKKNDFQNNSNLSK